MPPKEKAKLSRTPALSVKAKKFHPPQFCDFSCAYADFSQPDAIGACRKDIAVYCAMFKSYNNKNSSCIGRKQ